MSGGSDTTHVVTVFVLYVSFLRGMQERISRVVHATDSFREKSRRCSVSELCLVILF